MGAWSIAERLPRRSLPAIARVLSYPLHVLPLKGLGNWHRAVGTLSGTSPDRRGRRQAVEHWLLNLLLSMSLAHWDAREILARSIISDQDVAKLRDSTTGPGAVLALPHMGSWDFAGAWAGAAGFNVVSVAERLPGGVYERFRDAREGAGMTIYPAGAPRLLQTLADDVAAGRLVCLLSDRDISGQGLEVPWPAANGPVDSAVPAGPALLARATGADLRVAHTRFVDGGVEILISEPVRQGSPAEMMTAVAERFAAAAAAEPTNWLMFQRWPRQRR